MDYEQFFLKNYKSQKLATNERHLPIEVWPGLVSFLVRYPLDMTAIILSSPLALDMTNIIHRADLPIFKMLTLCALDLH